MGNRSRYRDNRPALDIVSETLKTLTDAVNEYHRKEEKLLNLADAWITAAQSDSFTEPVRATYADCAEMLIQTMTGGGEK